MRIFSLKFLRLPLGSYRFKSNTVIYQKPKHKIKIIKVNRAHVRSVPVTNNNEHISNGIQPKNETDINPKAIETVNQSPDYRENEMKIQMLSKNLHEQIFGNSKVKTIDNDQIKRFDLFHLMSVIQMHCSICDLFQTPR